MTKFTLAKQQSEQSIVELSTRKTYIKEILNYSQQCENMEQNIFRLSKLRNVSLQIVLKEKNFGLLTMTLITMDITPHQVGEGATKYDYDEVYQLWLEGKTPQELSKITGASDGTIQSILRASSVPSEKIHERAHSKPVIQFTTKGEYVCTHPSANAAGRALGLVNGSNIIKCCLGGNKDLKGLYLEIC